MRTSFRRGRAAVERTPRAIVPHHIADADSALVGSRYGDRDAAVIQPMRVIAGARRGPAMAIDKRTGRNDRGCGCIKVAGHSVEIGRAPCRERVCQYVEVTVVAVSLKKQTDERRITNRNQTK